MTCSISHSYRVTLPSESATAKTGLADEGPWHLAFLIRLGKARGKTEIVPFHVQDSRKIKFLYFMTGRQYKARISIGDHEN